jgi:hypothetical protein
LLSNAEKERVQRFLTGFLKCFLPCIRGIGQLVAPQARNTQDREQPRRTAIFRGVEEASGTGRPAAAAITSGTKLT